MNTYTAIAVALVAMAIALAIVSLWLSGGHGKTRKPQQSPQRFNPYAEDHDDDDGY